MLFLIPFELKSLRQVPKGMSAKKISGRHLPQGSQFDYLLAFIDFKYVSGVKTPNSLFL